MGDVPGIIFTS